MYFSLDKNQVFFESGFEDIFLWESQVYEEGNVISIDKRVCFMFKKYVFII